MVRPYTITYVTVHWSPVLAQVPHAETIYYYFMSLSWTCDITFYKSTSSTMLPESQTVVKHQWKKWTHLTCINAKSQIINQLLEHGTLRGTRPLRGTGPLRSMGPLRGMGSLRGTGSLAQCHSAIPQRRACTLTHQQSVHQFRIMWHTNYNVDMTDDTAATFISLLQLILPGNGTVAGHHWCCPCHPEGQTQSTLQVTDGEQS